MDKKKLKALKDFIISSEKSLRSAKRILKEMLGEAGIEDSSFEGNTEGLHSYSSEDSKIVEGVFSGEEMLGADGNSYPVPANYASKSKLVQGDKLKLTIAPDGKMLYKQIEHIDRETKVGLLTKDNGRFFAIVEEKTYNVLTASVTHFKGQVGDKVSVILPAGKEATFATIDSVIPNE